MQCRAAFGPTTSSGCTGNQRHTYTQASTAGAPLPYLRLLSVMAPVAVLNPGLATEVWS